MSSVLAVGGVVGASVLVPSYGGSGTDDSKTLMRAYQQASQGKQQQVSDVKSKNLLSRSPEAKDAPDPTTAARRREGVATVEAQRAEPDPELVPIAAQPDRQQLPQDRYAMAGGCYAMKADGAGWVVKQGSSYAATGDSRSAAAPIHFQAADLGKYLLFDADQAFLSAGTPVSARTPGNGSSIWTVKKAGKKRYALTNGDRGLTGVDQLTTGPAATAYKLRLTSGCAEWPEITTNIEGRTFKGVSPFQEVRGTADAHTHGMAFEFLGGGAHCGRPWSPFGVTVALVDCPDHTTTNGQGAILESFLSGKPSHDPVGWPTFKDWPAPDSLTHEGTYYKWLERAWQGGMRLFTNLLVENNQLCMIYPIKGEAYSKTHCDDMATVRLEAQDMRDLERYIDAQYGGPGKGWYRIVTNPFQARKVINEGKLAVVMGIETSLPFGCTFTSLPVLGDAPACSAGSIDKQLDDVYKMGVRQMELTNKFDNALTGVAGDAGSTGVLVNGANFLETKTFWNMKTCKPSYGEGVEDREQYALPGGPIDAEQQDALFGAILDQFGLLKLPAVPLYPPAPHCNQRGLTTLGEHTIRGLAKRHMLFDPDHMSVVARKSSLDLIEKLGYSGILSSHSWSTPDAYPRIIAAGGVVYPYAGDSTGFVDKWKAGLGWADPRYYYGIGYGADINGLGAQGNPRGANAENPVTYPFTGLGGVTVDKQVSGQRVYDINTDGVAHYGLYPDWLQDLQMLAGPDITTDMSRGAEAYLQMWERAVGVSNDACRQPSLTKSLSVFRGLRRGMGVRDVLMAAGQPHSRLGTTLGYCAENGRGDSYWVNARFTDGGKLRKVGYAVKR